MKGREAWNKTEIRPLVLIQGCCLRVISPRDSSVTEIHCIQRPVFLGRVRGQLSTSGAQVGRAAGQRVVSPVGCPGAAQRRDWEQRPREGEREQPTVTATGEPRSWGNPSALSQRGEGPSLCPLTLPWVRLPWGCGATSCGQRSQTRRSEHPLGSSGPGCRGAHLGTHRGRGHPE